MACALYALQQENDDMRCQRRGVEQGLKIQSELDAPYGRGTRSHWTIVHALRGKIARET